MLLYLQIVLLQRMRRDEGGLATAELLGNAALGVAALVVIWAALQALGLDIVTWIRAQVMG
ncbi:MAG TPA: hypothetical protein VIK61_06420 [Acidimicrobiia bacterium]